ncbi:uncharacterized protein [Anoplolepis gracilipes]|uniref:uncharacterized protein n=1 Tax=Anoplolepis gracilipes TaxID=354296 RepID=UPI003B9EBAF4
MRILQMFGFFIILWQDRVDSHRVSRQLIFYSVPFNGVQTQLSRNVVTRGCKNLENTTPLLRLKKYLFCDYDNTVRPNHHKVVTNVTVKLTPKIMEFVLPGGKDILILHSWMSLTWTDTHLTWTPENFDGVNYIHVKSYDLWVPDLSIYNSGDMSNDLEMPTTDCLVFNTGSVVCVPAIKYISKCDGDYTYWPYDVQKCRIVFGSWSHAGEEIDFHLDESGISMDSYENNTLYDLKFIDAVKHVKKYKCCPNDTFPKIDYTFLLTRHYGINHKTVITPAIALILLTLTVLWLDSRSVERTAVASVNLICHLFSLYDLQWQMPYNGDKPPHIMLFYRDSLALATFALILTVLLRKLQNINTDMPNWISSTTTFILSNKAGRFLILNDEESKITGESIIEDSSGLPKSGMKESWRHFAAIVEWLSFFCVIVTYVIILITLVPMGFLFSDNTLLNDSVVLDSSFIINESKMNKSGLLSVLLFILNSVHNGVTASSCNDVESKSTILRLKRHLLCEYDPDVRPVQTNNNITRITFRLIPHFVHYDNEEELFELHAWIGMAWRDSHLTWDPAQYDNINSIYVTSDEIWVPDILIHNERIGESSMGYNQAKCWVGKQGTVQWLTAAKYTTYCFADNTWWPYNTMNCTLQIGSWSYSNDEIELIPLQNMSLELSSKDAEWDLLKMYVRKWEDKHKYNSSSKTKMLSYHFILRRHWGIIRIAYIMPSIVLMVMTLTALWLEPKSFERMVIANLSFICHLLCIQDIHWEVPKSGSNVPKLIIFYESSFAITSFTLILTNILRHLQELTTEPPTWISASTTSILRSRIGQILLVSILDPAVTAKIEIDADDNTDLVQSATSSKKSPWRYVVILVGWIAFLSVLLAYIILLSTSFPTYYTVIP